MRKFVSGLLVGLLVAFAASANAETPSLVGKVVQGEITIFLNGEELGVKGAIIDGVTRVPVRALAENLGLSVSYYPNFGVNLTSPSLVPSVEPSSEEIPELEAIIVPGTTQNTTENKTKEQLQNKLNFINQEMSLLNHFIATFEKNIQSAKTEEIREQYRANLSKALERKAQIEAEKAELEAQLAATPE